MTSKYARLSRKTVTLPMSPIGEPCPMPHYHWQQPIPLSDAPPVGLTDEETLNLFNWGEDSILPYQVQENYSRSLQDGELDVIQLENDRFGIQVAPRLGGRLLSIFDKQNNRDLIFKNPVFQPANLAALNAWFSGGVEWNGLTPGHSPTRCSPIFVDQVDTERGPVLRLFEFDRTTECVWQIDLFLPEGKAPLTFHGRIINPNATSAYVYWWTNIAVATPNGGRVLSPADYTIEHVLPDNHLERFELVRAGKYDISYPENWQSATSVFFRANRAARNLVAVVDKNGHGTAHVATSTLVGRKFFYFGSAPGGQHWMDFLSRAGEGDYLEIQAGITPTQNQRLELTPNAQLDWTAAIFPISLLAEDAHDPDYKRATDAVEVAASTALSDAQIRELDLFLSDVSRRNATHRLAQGAPWGQRHERLQEIRMASNLDFSTEHQSDFWDDLADGREPAPSQELPIGFALSPRWLAQMKVLSETDWRSFLYQSIAALNNDQPAEAHKLAQNSLERHRSWLGYRQLALTEPNPRLARDHYFAAWASGDAPAALAIEITQFLQRHFSAEDLAEFLSTLPEGIQNEERIQLAAARLAAESGDLGRLENLLDRDFAQIREGETVTEELWQSLIRLRFNKTNGRAPTAVELKSKLRDNPIPARLDFRMLTNEPTEETLNGKR